MSLALEYIGKLMIVLVVVAVVIGFILNYYNSIPSSFFPDNVPPETETIKGTFDAKKIASEIQACWLKTGGQFRKDIVCSVLLGTFNVAGHNEIANSLPVDMQGSVIYDVDYSKSAIVIEFLERGPKIRLRN